MTPEDFVSLIRTLVFDADMADYRQLFCNTAIEKASDPYFKRALTLFGSLTPQQKEVLFEIMRQVCVDTAVSVLSVIDGLHIPNGQDEFELRHGGGPPLNGDLYNLLLADIEMARPTGT